MKKILTLFSVVLTTALLTGCADENTFGSSYMPSSKAHYVYLPTTEVTLGAEANSKATLNVMAEATPWQFKGMDSWLTVSPQNGNADASVTLTATENTSVDNIRTTVFQFSSMDTDYERTQSVTATQAAATPYLEVSNETMAFAAHAPSQTITVSTNLEYTATSAQSWIHPVVSKDRKTVSVAVDDNTQSYSRTGSISIRGNGLSASVSVTQRAPGAPEVDASTMSYTNTGGTYSLSLTSEVAWTASTSVSWLDVTPSSGSAGTNTLTIMATPNTSVNDRTGYVYVYVGGSVAVTIPVTQRGLYIEASQTTFMFKADAMSAQLQVSCNTSWQVLEKPTWLTVSDTEGTGDATLTLSVPDYWETSNRTGVLKLGQEGSSLSTTVQVIQYGRSFDDLVASLSFDDVASSQSLPITTDGRWTATSSADWITVSPASGTGNATLTVAVSENTGDDTRTGAVKVTVGNATQTILISQKGKYFTINPTAFSELPSKGGTHTLHISTNDTWSATKGSSWMTLSKTSGTGDIDVTMTVADNPSLKSRKDTTVFTPTHAQPIRVITSQAGRYMTIDTHSLAFYSKGGMSPTINVSTDATFTVATSASWLTINRDGNSFTVTAEANDTEVDRTAKITLAMQGLGNGESMSLTIDVMQRAIDYGVNITPFTEDKQWDLLNDSKATISVTGFSDEKQWDTVSQ